MKTYQTENKELFLNFLEDHFFKGWRENFEYSNSLEFILTKECNTKCSYCYYKNYGDKLNPTCRFDWERTIHNIELIGKWARKNSFHIRTIDIFSGEFFNTPHWERILNLIFSYFEEAKIVIPSNMTFLFNEEKTKKIEKYMTDYRERIYISPSVDGKLLDNETRAQRNGNKYTDEFYDKVFDFSIKYKVGLHPMIGAKRISKWKENFRWIFNEYRKRGVSEAEIFRLLYLLEVRNPDWKKADLVELADFMTFLVHEYHKAHPDPEECVSNMNARGQNANLFSCLLGHTGRGAGCSIQNTLQMMPNSMELVLCHRLSYDGYKACRFKISEEGDFDIDILNPLEYMMMYSLDQKKMYKCADCEINTLCTGCCLGCDYEVNRDPFIPVETVCDLEFYKIFGLLRGIEQEGLYPYITRLLRDEGRTDSYQRQKLKQIETFMKSIKETNNDI